MKLNDTHSKNKFFGSEIFGQFFHNIKKIDYWILFIYITLISFSIILVYSTSFSFSSRNFKDPRYLFNKHLIGVILSLITMFIGFILSDQFFKKYNNLVSITIIVLLLAPLLPVIGLSIGGSSRWVQMGFFNFQPSEIAKILIIFYLAYQIAYKKDIKELSKDFIPTLVFIAIGGLLILLQRDFSTSLIFFSTMLFMLFINNFSSKDLLKLIGFASIGLLPFIIFSPYRLERITMFFNFHVTPSSAYQIIQSVSAFNRGGFLGLGPGQGSGNIPYIFNDFIFAAIGEEFGFIGGILILILFFILIQRSLRISKILHEKSDIYGSLVVFGITMSFAVQIIINISVTMALTFPTGITLPFLSYGRTSLIVSSFCIGLLLKYSQKTYKFEK